MGKWKEMQCTTNPKKWFIYDADGEMTTGEWIGEACDEEMARQIVREHNAHGDLLELARAYREGIQSDMDECDRPDLIEVYEGALKNIDAVLARAEGRE